MAARADIKSKNKHIKLQFHRFRVVCCVWSLFAAETELVGDSTIMARTKTSAILKEYHKFWSE